MSPSEISSEESKKGLVKGAAPLYLYFLRLLDKTFLGDHSLFIKADATQNINFLNNLNTATSC